MKTPRKMRGVSQVAIEAERVLQLAVADVVDEHQRLELPIAVCEGGRAVFKKADVAALSAYQRRYLARKYRTRHKYAEGLPADVP